MTFIARIFVTLIFLFPWSASAAEPLIFKPASDDIREQSVLAYLQENHDFDPAIPFAVATNDLNADGVKEWIVRQDIPDCATKASCPFYLAGLRDRKPVLLGTIPARKIGITGQKSYGVYQLVVYNDPNDDFTYKSYSWDPSTGFFTLP